MLNKIICIKDVIMDDGEIAFKRDKEYRANTERYYIIAINEQGEEHCLGNTRDDDRFYYNHFKKKSQ